jgi:fatty-acyl-CoA synthase
VDLTTRPTWNKEKPGSIIATRGYWVNNWIARHADINANQLVLIDEKSDRRFTYRSFNERVDRIAAFLKNNFRIKKGDRVAMLSWNRIEMLDILFAASKLGGIFVPINTRYTPREIKECLRSFKPKVLIHEEEFADKVTESLGGSVIEHYMHLGRTRIKESLPYTDAENYSARLQKPELMDLEDPVMILQTGGTTGKPKGSIVTYRMLFWNAMMTARDLIVPGEVTVTCVPLFHIGGYTYTIPLLLWGGTNVLMYRWNAEKLIDWIETERVSFQFLVPVQLKTFTNSPRFGAADLRSVRWFTTGGAALTRETVELLLKKGVIMKQGFGLTEVGPGVFALDPRDALRKIGSIGKPNLLIDVRVVDQKGKDATYGLPGELLIRAPSLFGGYWRNPSANAGALKRGWLCTGDIVKFDEEGFFYIVGRKKRVIRSGSESIYPEELERVLSAHPKIADVTVIGIPDQKWGEVPQAFIVVRTGERLAEEDVREYCKDKLAKYKIPKHIKFVDSIPKTPAGKVLKDELIRKCVEQ